MKNGLMSFLFKALFWKPKFNYVFHQNTTKNLLIILQE